MTTASPVPRRRTRPGPLLTPRTLVPRSRAAEGRCVRVSAVPAVLTALVAGVLGLGAGHLVNRLAGRFPWSAPGERRLAVRPPLVELGTAVLFALTGLQFGWSWELPA